MGAVETPAKGTEGPRSSRIPLAFRNVAHEKYKSLTAIAGISFAVILILMQLGFLEVVKITATNIFEKLDYDVAIISRVYEQLYDPGSIPLQRLMQARAAPGVTDSYPVYTSMNLWRCPPMPLHPGPPPEGIAKVWHEILKYFGIASDPKPTRLRGLLVVGFQLDNIPFLNPIRAQIEAHESELRLPNRILFDSLSHPDFGYQYRDEYSQWELGRKEVTIVGSFTLGTGFGADATVLCSDLNYLQLSKAGSLERVNLGLVKTEPGRAEEATVWLREHLPPDVQVFTREQLLNKEQRHWIQNTATGVLFGFGVFVAVCVGTVVVYQVLSNDVTNHFAEYATLKAMGYTNGFLARVVANQAMLYAMAAYFPALLISIGLYRLTEMVANIPMRLTLTNVLLVFVLTLVMCLASAFLTLRKVRSTDPADLF